MLQASTLSAIVTNHSSCFNSFSATVVIHCILPCNACCNDENRMDLDKNRLLHQLDKVCEEKDEEIKELKQSLYERNIEFDHQMNLAKEEKKCLHDEILDLKSMMAFLKAASENDVQQLAEEKSELSK